MLVLTRKSNEEIMIGDDVVIRVLHTRSGSVKIGVVAPVGVGIRRGELAPLDSRPVGAGLRLVAETGDESVSDGGKQAI